MIEVTPPPGQKADPASFQNRVFYELWIRSYQDSDSDGIGDFAGAIDRLDELASMGIGGVWLMPTFESPLADSGYDVADYNSVHPDYGTISDLEEFVNAAHEKNILVYLDMVFNHVSDQHGWFQSALTGPQSPYFDFFVWSTQPTTQCTDVPAGPFGNERWTKVDKLGLYYLHQFLPRQPDLNFRNPDLQTALLDVLEFWMDRGVDGFRFDVPDRFFENGNLCSHQPETVTFHGKLRETISGTGTLDRGFVGEIWGTVEQNLEFFGPTGNPMIFNFELLFATYTSIIIGNSPGAMVQAVDVMLDGLPAESRWGLINGNHDTPRLAELASGDRQRLRLAAAVQMTLPGVPFMWMGEELGMPGGVTFNVDFRDGARTPYPWTDEPGIGFTSGPATHLPVAPFSEKSAFSVQTDDPRSLLNYYRLLISLRNQYRALHSGGFRTLSSDQKVWVFERLHDQGNVIVAHNFSRHESVDLQHYSAVPRNAIDLLTGRSIEETDSLGPGQSVVIARP